MDDTLEYVEMCRKAPEIQEAWKPSAWDYLYCDNINAVVVNSGYCTDAGYYGHDYDDHGGVFNCQDGDGSRDYHTWIPLQHQLQDIVKDIDMVQFNNPLYSLQFEFDNFVMEHKRLPSFRKLTSFEQLWLCFVMHVKYCKVWDGSEWVSA